MLKEKIAQGPKQPDRVRRVTRMRVLHRMMVIILAAVKRKSKDQRKPSGDATPHIFSLRSNVTLKSLGKPRGQRRNEW